MLTVKIRCLYATPRALKAKLITPRTLLVLDEADHILIDKAAIHNIMIPEAFATIGLTATDIDVQDGLEAEYL